MRYEFKKSFNKCIKNLPEEAKLAIKELAFDTIDVISTGKKPSKGMRLTRLRKDYWEVSTTMKERIVFKLIDDLIQFILAGNHDHIKRFLKRV
ncbi:MAG: hypothetical protein KAU58_04940 [Candidatus Omnitrophica bacterium]|nr:hypothetical protein [Candidatus Omnitrophota bacterium]